MSVYDDAYRLYKIDKQNPYPEESKEWTEWEEAVEDARIDEQNYTMQAINQATNQTRKLS